MSFADDAGGGAAAAAAAPEVEFGVAAETLRPPFRDEFPGYADGMSRGRPGRLWMPATFAERVGDLRRFRPRSDDVWVLTFPKCGTTWVSEMVWLINNDCDFRGAAANQNARIPFLELAFPWQKRDELVAWADLPSPRTVKSHLPFYLLHPKLIDTSKVVYVARNPKDVIVSYFHHHKLVKFMEFTSGIEQFATHFMNDTVLYAPYFPHVLEAWKLRHQPNLLFIFYEDLKRDLRGGIRKVADFLEKPLTEEQVTRLKEHLSFESIAKNEAVNKADGKKAGYFVDGDEHHFIRKGKTGDWKNHFDAELNERIDRWIESNLAGSDLHFVTELAEQD